MWVPHVIWVFLLVIDKINMPQILKVCGFSFFIEVNFDIHIFY